MIGVALVSTTVAVFTSIDCIPAINIVINKAILSMMTQVHLRVKSFYQVRSIQFNSITLLLNCWVFVVVFF